MSDPVEQYGFTAVPRDPDVLFRTVDPSIRPLNLALADLPFPDSPLVSAAKAFVLRELDTPTFNHSHRVFLFGSALVRSHFPQWTFDPAAYYLACLFHDIGTCERFLASTKMSFEFKGAIVARETILAHGGPEDLADSICEAVIRHQDIFVKGGNITVLGQVLQLATILDNIGLRADLLHADLIAAATAAFPRLHWGTRCFPAVIERELALKPWAHTSSFEVPAWRPGMPSAFATDVRANERMNRLE